MVQPNRRIGTKLPKENVQFLLISKKSDIRFLKQLPSQQNLRGQTDEHWMSVDLVMIQINTWTRPKLIQQFIQNSKNSNEVPHAP